MDRILVLAPHEDRGARAVLAAGDLAERTGAEIILLRVLEEGPEWRDGAGVGLDPSQLRQLVVEAETRELEHLAGQLRGRARAVDVRVRWGVAWESVLELVDQLGVDLVVKPAHGLGRGGPVFFGSTALHLFRRCPCPVWVVGGEGRLPTRVLAAVDPASGVSRRVVARRIVELAQRVGTWSQAEVHVVSAWHAPGAELMKGLVPDDDLREYLEDARSRAIEGLEAVAGLAPAPIPPDRVHLIEGNPRDALPPFVEAKGFDLVVMGTLGRAGVVGELLGETAETIIRSVRSSVLTVAPERG
jgi:universal stress protein E